MSGAKKYAGAEWLRGLKKEVSPFGAIVADILGQAFLGIYHMPRSITKSDWTDDRFIEVICASELATFDGNELTRLVTLCHDNCVRLGITGCSPGRVRLTFTRRKRSGSIFERHPTFESHATMIRDHLSLGEDHENV